MTQAGPAQPYPLAADLQAAWEGQASCTLLDTDFGSGQHFLQTWRMWRQCAERPAMLHYVGISPVAPDIACDETLSDVDLLKARCRGLDEGFWRLHFEGGRISLTLCVGDLRSSLREMSLEADLIWTGPDFPLDIWCLKSLAQRCRRGTRVHFAGLPALQSSALAQAGFSNVGMPDKASCVAIFNPDWTIRRSRASWAQMKLPPGRCAVVGAGLAGASVAHALALRGWQVAVFDTCPVVAAGASGLPAGLLVAHSSTDNSPRSRLTRSGARLMLGHARQHLQEGQDWALPGVMEYKMLRGGMRQQIWHPDAGWLKPGRMVQAWMGHPAITFNPNRKVRALEYFAGVWILRDRQLRELGHADLVVLANAMGCGPLLASLPSGVTPDANLIRQANCLQAVHGFLTIGDRIALEKRTLRQALPKFPVNGSGSFIPEVPMADTARWFTGSTYASVEPDLSAIAEMHQNNIGRIGAILPDLADTLQYELDSTVLQHWTGVRCITRDRMPLVGPVHAQEPRSLWLCTGLGSRGLSLAALCAELLVARVCSEPLPIELNLAKKLDAARPFREV